MNRHLAFFITAVLCFGGLTMWNGGNTHHPRVICISSQFGSPVVGCVKTHG